MDDVGAIEQRIEAAYRARGDRIGWRLLYSPVSVLQSADVAFLGLNPGGTFEPPDHPRLAQPHGSAYETESWHDAPPGRDKLQIQVRSIFARLGVRPCEVLAGNLVPFRSPSWSALADKQHALSFGKELWGDLLQAANPSLVVGLGNDVFEALQEILRAGPVAAHSVGWGNISGRRAKFAGGLCVGLPHLSRFTIVGRQKSEQGLANLFGERWRG